MLLFLLCRCTCNIKKQLVLCTEYRAPNLIVVSVSPGGAELDASDRILEAVKCTKVMEQHGLYPQSILTMTESLSCRCNSTASIRLHVVYEEHATSASCMQSHLSAQDGTKEWGNEAARVPYPASVLTLLRALVLKDAWRLGLLGCMPCRFNRSKIVPGSKASIILDVLSSSCQIL